MVNDLGENQIIDTKSVTPPRGGRSGYALTSLQSGMLFHQIREIRGVDLEQIVCQTPELIDLDAFADALQSLTAFHPVLRTRFVWNTDKEPWQEIEDEVAPSVEFIDLTRLPNDLRSADFREHLLEDRNRPFDLSVPPLLRAKIFHYGTGETRILLTLHHAIVDGRSFPILLEDLFGLYEAHLRKLPLPAREPQVEFRQFVEWTLARDFESDSRDFWKDCLKGFTAPTPLTVDDLSDCEGNALSWQEEISLSTEETAALEGLANDAAVTLNTVVQSAWALLLSKYSSETDVVFGGTRACRNSSLPNLENAVGLFINTLPVRVSADPEKSLSQLLGEVRNQWVAMRDHEHTPLSRIQAWSDLEKGQPLFHSILVFEKFDLDELMKARGGSWEKRKIELYEKTNFPLTVAAYHGHRLRIKIEFENEKFSPETIQRMLGHLRSLLVQFAAKPEAPLSEFRLTTDREIQQLHEVWASPVPFPIPGTLAEWFENQVAETPENTALSFEGRSWTYREVNEAANRVAHALIAKEGVQRGDIIGLCVDRSPEIVIGILGILKSGAAYLPIDLAYPADRLLWMLEDSAAPVLLTQEALLGRLPGTKAKAVTFESLSSDERLSTQNPSVGGIPDDLAYVIFTSGSTGKPKGCRITNRNVARLMTATEAFYDFNESDVWTLFHSFAFDFSVWEIWGALLYGGRVVVVPYDTTRSPDEFYQLLVRERVTVLNQTPSAFRQLIAAEERAGGTPDAMNLRLVIFGGEALELESLRSWFDRHGDQTPKLINMYGITETTVHVTYRPISQEDLTRGSVIGRQIPDLEIHLFDPAGHPVPIGVPGEIYVGGAGVAAGYLNRPGLTAERFLPHPSRSGETLYRTGDVARFLPGGDLEYLGRCDDQVKIRGFRIELGEIQSVLTRHPSVREAFVTVLGDGADKRIVAYLVGNREATTLKELRAFAGEALPPYMLPAAILFLDQFPLTNNGKIDRKALPKPEDEIRSLSTTTYQVPQGKTETILSRIWAKVLKLERVGRDENYFELGGDSILSIQIVSQARRTGLKLSPRHLFEHQTIEELAAVAGSMNEAPTVNQEAVHGPAPLTPIQSWFFDHELPNPNHWNQAFLFNLSEPLEVSRLKKAFAGLVKRHEALRTAYRQSSQEVLAESKVEFCQCAGDLTESEIHDRCLDAQRALDIETGRLVSVAYFERVSERSPARLFIAIHHLAVDGVSWRILLEDLEALYFGKTVEPITTPFVNWAHHLATASKNGEFESQRTWWEANAKPFRLSPDQPITTAGDAESITVSLSNDETERLTTKSVPAMRAQLEEVLVAAVSGAIAKATGTTELSMDLEGHGREEAAGSDLSRTVGWFTTIYPIALKSPGETSFPRLIAETKKAMRAVPDRGFGFGLLGIDDPGRDVLFNYLGRFDQVTSESQLFSFANENSGSWYDPQSSRSHLLEINSWIKDGCLEIKWTFAALAKETVETMANESIGSLRQIQKNGVPKTEAWIAADFSLAPIRDGDLAKLSGEVEDVLPLTPLQQLYYTLETARPGSGIDQWHWTLTGKVDPVALHEAWETAVNAHPGLRTAFLGAGLAEPVQVVRPRCTIPFEIVEITDESEFEAILKADRAKGLPIDDPPLMRLTLVENSGSDSRLIWTHHHLQVDGWSWPLLLSQVSEAYRAIRGDLAMEPLQGKSIRDYLKWYRQVDLTESRHFWQAHLSGFAQPTPVSSRSRGNAVFHDLSASLGEETVTKLNELARRLKCPLNAIVQSAWAILLSKQSGQDDVVFGATFSGRPAELSGVESIIGAFVNNLPVRVRLDESSAFDSLARSLQSQAVELGEHQHLPLGDIQQLSAVPLRSRLFESLLVFQNYTIDGSAMQWAEDLSVTNFVAPVRTNYPLTLVVKPGSGSLNFDLIFQGGRFDQESAARVLEALCALLVQVADSPDLGVRECFAAVTLPTIKGVEIQSISRGSESQPPVTGLQKKIARVWERAFGISDLGIDENFFDLGGHSLLLIQVHALLRRELNEELSVVDVFSHPTIRKLAAAIEGGEEKGTESLVTRTISRPRVKTDDIAIIGMSGRFPGAESVAEFWDNLVHQVESIVDFSDEELRSQGLNPEAMRSAGHYVQRRGQIPDPDQFDAAFFGMSPLEATATDPQQRLFLETAWSALEDAGYAPSRVKDRIGVYAGMSNNSFYEQYVQADEELRLQLGDLIVMMGNEKDYLATRTAYKLNLNGPALNVYTACSTSLVAVAEAVYALREGRCEMAIAGAVSLTFPQNRGYYYEEGGITSADGHCRPFDANSGGTVFSNGMAAVILKPLDQAIEAGDTIHAVVRGVGLNNDGSDKVSFTAPSVAGQAGAIREACAQAGVSPETIRYVEGHGTATALGDPIEFQALTMAYRETTDKTQFCGLGSVKSNLGHLDAAAGMAGLIKSTLALREAMIPATLHCTRPHPGLQIESSPFRIISENEIWNATNGIPRRAGVSSFGVGGTNAHLVLEEAPANIPVSPSPRRGELILLSAKSAEALRRKREDLADFLEKNPSTSLPDLAFTLAVGRETFSHRLAFVAATNGELMAKLRADETKERESKFHDLPVSFLFPGQGAQFPGMGKDLYETEPVFKAALDQCAETLHPLIGKDIRTLMFDDSEGADILLNQTRFTQPALFVMSYGLAQLWKAHGVSPVSMIGHSVGEYSAACLAESIGLEAALHLIAARARMVNDLPGGSMLSIRLPENEVRPILIEGVEVAAVNSPLMTVVAGTSESIAALVEKLTRENIPHRELRTSHAFHSAMMESVIAPFGEEVAKVSFTAPAVPYVSNVSGTWVTGEMVASPDYWAGHVRKTVRFEEGVRCLAAEQTGVLLEVGPGRSCVTFARQSIVDSADYPVLTSLPKGSVNQPFLETVGELWAVGGRIDWSTYFGAEKRRRLPLPTYPFERKRFWPKGQSLNLPLAARQLASEPMETIATIEEPSAPEAVATSAGSRRDRLVEELAQQIQHLTGLDEVDGDQSFLDLGLDSLLIGQAAVTLSRHFGTRITFKHLMDDFDSVNALAGFLDESLDSSLFLPAPAVTPVTVTPMASGGSLEDRVTRIEATLHQLASGGLPASTTPRLSEVKSGYEAGELHRGGQSPMTFGPFRPVEAASGQTLTDRQQAHLAALIRDYTSRTPKSKAHIQSHRASLADPRAAAGFNGLWKEMVYPLVTTRSQGAYLWDLDENQWVDVTHGFGLGLFGHRPDFVVKAVAAQLDTGFEIGPSSPLAGEVAEMLCEVSGKDRATFCNTGSEAVTAAIRIARTVSHRDKIAVFQGSYHGIFDEVLGRPLVKNGQLVTAPIAPGITEASLENILILDYGNPESLEFIRRYADDLAAVIVEPVQSRRPDLQPREFLKELRKLTATHDIALVFDEVVTGFRTHPRGAQGVFDIDADLVTYGKVLGGGMPIGALAGRRKYMDALDGGDWQFGDDSGPEASVTFFAGTFVRHPLALAAARAVLIELKRRGGELQETLDQRTEEMVGEMNAFCDRVGVPAKVTRFSSMYFINFAPSLKQASLFFYHMRLRGIHIWETRPSFLSVAHSDADVEAILEAFRDSIRALQEGGFFPGGENGATFPVTPEQEELLIASAMSEEFSRSFNESISMIFEGNLDREALHSAVRTVVGRHESLRSVFEKDGSSQRFVPADQIDVKVTEVDLREASPEGLSHYREEVLTELFRLDLGPLFRFHLMHLEDARWELLIVSHHAVCDGWSFGVIYDDLLAHYRRASGDAVDLPPVTPFREFAERQGSPESIQACGEDTGHWVKELATLPPSLKLPADLRETTPSCACRSTSMRLPDSLCREVLRFCKESRITPYALFFSAYRDILTRLSGQESFCIGTPIASQAASGLPGLCGHGVHFLPLPCQASEADTTVGDFLTRNRSLILDSLDHQQTTLSRILQKLPEGKRLDPVLATFTLETCSPAWEANDLRVSLQVNPKRFSTFDLSLFATESHGQFSLLANFRKGKFSRERVDGWLDLMKAWLEAVVQSPATTTLADLALIKAPEPAVEPETADVISLFEEQVRRTPARIALRWESGEYSYETVNHLANAVGHRLQSAGVSPGSRVMLEVDRSSELVLVIIAILKCRGVYIPIDPDYPEERRQLLREDADPTLVLDEEGLRGLFRDLVPTAEAPALSSGSDPEDPAYVMFTSGSTGRPKGAVLPHRALTHLVRDPGCIAFNENDVFLLSSPISFDPSILEVWGPLLNGGCLAIPSRGALSIHDIAECLSQFDVSILWLTAGLFQVMMEERAESLVGLRILLTGGDVFSPRHAEKALDLLPNTVLINGYGPTENTTFTTCHVVRREDLERASIPIGKSIPGTTAYVFDERGKPLPAGLEGELYAGGAGLALGYLNRPNLTAEKFVSHPFSFHRSAKLYRTGDRCRQLPDGSFEFLGRIDHQVKIRGFRIEPGELESVIESQPGITGCRVVVRGEGAIEKSLVAFCTGDPTARASVSEKVKRTLPKYLHPSSIEFVTEFPLAPTGKVDTKALVKRLITPSELSPEQAPSYVPPATPTEKAVHGIWTKLLGRNGFGVTETFFELGGHSLLGLRLFSRLQTEFDFVSPLAILFERPTIRQLAAEIDRRSAPRESQIDEHLAVLKQEGDQTPLFLIHGGDGGIMFYQSIAEKLGELDCPIYALESPSLSCRNLEPLKFDELVSEYLGMIRATQPEGPYRIGGYSFGGIVAFEIAARLEAENEPVKLVLFDAANPVTTQETQYSNPARILAVWRRFQNSPPLVRCGKALRRLVTGVLHKSHHEAKVRRCRRLWKAGRLSDMEEKGYLLNELHQESLAGYAPSAGVKAALLIKSSEEIDRCDLPEDYGWGRWIERLEMFKVPGDHLSVFEPDGVETMADGLRDYLKS